MRIALLLLLLPQLSLAAEDAPLNHFQVIGTHNSYHLAPGKAEEVFIRFRGEAEVQGLAYSHPALSQQFDNGIRQIELDLFADPEGGRYAQPAVFQLSKLAGKPAPTPLLDPQGLMQKPGTKVLHFPNFDFRTNTLTLTTALTETLSWSQAHPQHHPIFILLELKGNSADWDNVGLKALEQEVLTTIPRKHLITPDDVRGKHRSLRAAILTQGWPSRDSLRGKIMLALDNTGQARSAYLKPDPLLKKRLFFPSCPSANHPSAGWFKINDPVTNFDRIKTLSQKGFLIRTRADAATREARSNDTNRRDQAFASGAHFISTDFPQANPKFSNYQVTLPKKAKEAYRFQR